MRRKLTVDELYARYVYNYQNKKSQWARKGFTIEQMLSKKFFTLAYNLENAGAKKTPAQIINKILTNQKEIAVSKASAKWLSKNIAEYKNMPLYKIQTDYANAESVLNYSVSRYTEELRKLDPSISSTQIAKEVGITFYGSAK
jgi:hypothetical protein